MKKQGELTRSVKRRSPGGKVLCTALAVTMLLTTTASATAKPWWISKYRVTFDNELGIMGDVTLQFASDGGSFIRPITKRYGESISLESYVPTKYGYTFKGWFTDPRTKQNQVTTFKFTKPDVLYAKWEKNPQEPINPKDKIMAKRRREKMSEGKKNIIAGLIQEYDIKTAEDIQVALKDLLGGTIQEMMEAELDEDLGYEEYERSDNTDYRNGVKHKTLRSSYGETPIDVPQDRDGDFDPQIVPKRKKDISAIEQKIIAMSAKGMTTRQISDIVEDIYGFEVSESMVTAVTNKILPQIEEWQQRPLSAVYPIVFIDAIHSWSA